MVQQPISPATQPFDSETPPADTVKQQLSHAHLGSENVASDSKSPSVNQVADPHYIAEVALEVYAHIVKAWELDDSNAERLLDVDSDTWMQIKNGTWSESLEQEQLMRISAVMGLHRALHSCFNESLANRWVKRPNTGPIFSGEKPIDVMIKGGLQVMIKVRHYMSSSLGIE